jgi:hypothetical protein
MPSHLALFATEVKGISGRNRAAAALAANCGIGSARSCADRSVIVHRQGCTSAMNIRSHLGVGSLLFNILHLTIGQTDHRDY